MLRLLITVLALVAVVLSSIAEESALTRHWLWSRARTIPYETTSEQSGYFSIIEGKNGNLYIGTAKYGENAFLVEFDPKLDRMKTVVDAQREIGTSARGMAAQAKIHTRNHVGPSGRIYFGTKQGYPKMGEKPADYPGGYPMVYDPATGKTKVYPIPVPQQGVISVMPDEARGLAYVSTCSDERPVESAHFLVLDLKTGQYRDLIDTRHMYSFIVLDHLGRAYHPLLGGNIARFDPQSGTLERLKQTIDGASPTAESHLADPQSHPINWEVSPDRKTLYAVAMSSNQLHAYDLTSAGDTLQGRSLGKLIPTATATDCRAMCVGHDGTIWAGVAATFENRGQFLHLASYRPGDSGPVDHGPIAIGNPDYARLTESDGRERSYHHGVYRLKDGTLLPRFTIMGICAARDGTVYVTTLCPFTLHAIRIPNVVGLATTYYENTHADLFFTRMLRTDTLDGKGQFPSVRLRSLLVDQVAKEDVSLRLFKDSGVAWHNNPDAWVERHGPSSVDGVFLIAEHGKYPVSETGQIVYPKRRMFESVLRLFEKTGRVAPVFIDKHLADNWTDAKWIYDKACSNRIPLMAGSSVPLTWRIPAADVKRGRKLRQIVAVSYHTLDGYGFHALEAVQSLAERRAGGETGITQVQCLVGEKVWQAARNSVYDNQLLDRALSRLKDRPIPKGRKLEELVQEPVLFVIDYQDGLRACILTLNHAVAEWAAAWQYEDKTIESTLFRTEESRPFGHFTFQVMGIEKMMHSGQPTWPVERTLLTSGALDALLKSKQAGGRVVATPYLGLFYHSTWDWQQPPRPDGN